MAKIYIKDGVLVDSIEPDEGAFIVTYRRVVDSAGRVPSTKIQWNGPGHWISNKDGVPAGYTAIWLGTESVVQPLIVYAEDKLLPESERYFLAYLKAWKAKRRPVIPLGAEQSTVDGLVDGWRATTKQRTGREDTTPLSQQVAFSPYWRLNEHAKGKLALWLFNHRSAILDALGRVPPIR